MISFPGKIRIQQTTYNVKKLLELSTDSIIYIPEIDWGKQNITESRIPRRKQNKVIT